MSDIKSKLGPKGLEAATDLWDAATNAVCQTMQDRGMCNCPDGDCLAAKVHPTPQDLAWFSQKTTLAPADNGLVERLRAGMNSYDETETDDGVIELYDIEGANDLMAQAADTITAQAARLSAQEALLDKAVEGLEGMVRLSDMGFDESMREPQENGNFAAYEAARSTLTAIQEARHAGN